MIQNPHAQQIAENAFSGAGNGPLTPSIIAIDGQEIDPRMLAQMSRFTVHSDSTPLELLSTESPNWLRQYMIPKKAKAKIRAQLAALRIRRSNVFPDLENLAGELRDAIIDDAALKAQ